MRVYEKRCKANDVEGISHFIHAKKGVGMIITEKESLRTETNVISSGEKGRRLRGMESRRNRFFLSSEIDFVKGNCSGIRLVSCFEVV